MLIAMIIVYEHLRPSVLRSAMISNMSTSGFTLASKARSLFSLKAFAAFCKCWTLSFASFRVVQLSCRMKSLENDSQQTLQLPPFPNKHSPSVYHLDSRSLEVVVCHSPLRTLVIG